MRTEQVKLLLSFDYEIFFGQHCGTVEKCLIEPTTQLTSLLNSYNYKASFFVDAGFLLKLKESCKRYPELSLQYAAIKKQLTTLSAQGHDIQLHIHPHWQDSHYDGDGWIIDSQRYRLHDFSEAEISEIVTTYKQTLELCSEQEIFAFRAGGWCLQPFGAIKKALQENEIWLDSTVFSDGHSDDPTRWFNFKNSPQQAYWHFSDDPMMPIKSGYFTELPISATKTSPLFFWKLAFHKKFSKNRFVPFGDGQAMIASPSYYIERLTRTTYGPVMIDGAKAGQLNKAFIEHLQLNDRNSIFNVMGHPKSLTPYSLIKLEQFLQQHKNISSITFQDLKHLKNETL